MSGHQNQGPNTNSLVQEECTFCEQFNSPPRPPNGQYTGLIIAGVFGFSGVAILALAFPFIRPAFRRICLPYVPATDTQVANVLKALSGRKGTLVDLGSGDGRIVSPLVNHRTFIRTFFFAMVGYCCC